MNRITESRPSTAATPAAALPDRSAAGSRNGATEAERRAAPDGDRPGAVTETAAVPEASPREIEEWLRHGRAILIDVREADEHARERIAPSRLLPLSRFDAASLAGAAQRGAPLVVHCRSGRRGADAVRQLIAAGCDRGAVVNMAGGIEAWKAAGLPTTVDPGVSRVSVMRQVQLTIGLLVLTGCALAWFVHPAFIALPAALGAGLTFAGATGTCGLALLLERMPWNRIPCSPGATAGRPTTSGR